MAPPSGNLTSYPRRCGPPGPPSAGPRPVYFLLHVPKTAGQTISWHLQLHCPGAFVDVDTAAGRRALAGDTSQIRAVSGHQLSRAMQAAFPGREIRKAVLLREPAGLQLSLYNFRMLSYRAKGLGTYSLDLHLKAVPRNFAAQFLLENWLGMSLLQRARLTDAEVFAQINAELAQFWFVGAHTDCDALLAKIAPDLGVPPNALRRNSQAEWHEQVQWEPLRAESLTVAQRTRIAADHPVDQALWETWHAAQFSPSGVRPQPLSSRSRPALVRARLHDLLRRSEEHTSELQSRFGI